MENSLQRMVPPALVALREKVAAWRRDKEGRRRMPDELWSEAILLAKEYGVHPVARHVEINYSRLKQLLGEPPRPQSEIPAGFVEISSDILSGGNTQVEISRPDGCRMTVRQVDGRTLAELAATFVGGAR